MEEVAESRYRLNEMAKAGSIVRGGRKLLWEENWGLEENNNREGGIAFRGKGAGMEKWEQEALLGGQWGPKQPDMEEEFDQI